MARLNFLLVLFGVVGHVSANPARSFPQSENVMVKTPSQPLGVFGGDFPVPFTLDIADNAIAALKDMSDYYTDKLQNVCPEMDGSDDGTVVCECARPNDVPAGAPPRVLTLDKSTVVRGARDANEGATAALECRPTLCYCPDGSRKFVPPPPLPTSLAFVPDKFFVSGLVDRLWDLYFGPAGLTRPPTEPRSAGSGKLVAGADVATKNNVGSDGVASDLMGFNDLLPALKAFRKRVDSYSEQLSSACPGDDPAEVECECSPGRLPTKPNATQTASVFSAVVTLSDLLAGIGAEEGGDLSVFARRTGGDDVADGDDGDVGRRIEHDAASILLECQPESCACLDGSVFTPSKKEFCQKGKVPGDEDEDPLPVEFLARFATWVDELLVEDMTCRK